jgi:hypothetical protein
MKEQGRRADRQTDLSGEETLDGDEEVLLSERVLQNLSLLSHPW